ncbi:uncharacterized protein [Ptychodera flava]|uniref:uncharacterized protein n=1 Tax=Ptychodera flava TaxID=63121 RepID=UPI00396A373A
MAMNHRRAAIIFDQLQRRSIWNFKLRYKIFLVVLVVFISTVYGDECSCEVGKFCDSIHGLCQLCTLCESLPDDNCAMCPHIDGDTNADGANTNDQGQGGKSTTGVTWVWMPLLLVACGGVTALVTVFVLRRRSRKRESKTNGTIIGPETGPPQPDRQLYDAAGRQQWQTPSDDENYHDGSEGDSVADEDNPSHTESIV